MVLHRIPRAVQDDSRCGAYAMCFIAHVIMGSPLPDNEFDLRTLHVNMRASFVEHLYSITHTPRPVAWGQGYTGESGLLPRMPDVFNICSCLHPTGPNEFSWEDCLVDCHCLPVVDTPLPPLPSSAERLEMIAPHGYAMGDDEVLFHLQHILKCLGNQPQSSTGVHRQYVILPPLTLHAWCTGDHAPMHEWIQQQGPFCDQPPHIVSVLWQDQHWIPIWFDPRGATVHCHVFHHLNDRTNEMILTDLAFALGFIDRVIHRVPNILSSSGLCGPMAISFIAHVVLGTRLPLDDHSLRHRSWNMKQVFADHISSHPMPLPVLWGWGESVPPPVAGEYRLLPRMPEWDPFVAQIQTMCVNILGIQGHLLNHRTPTWEYRPLPIMPVSDSAHAESLMDDGVEMATPLVPDTWSHDGSSLETAMGHDELMFHLQVLCDSHVALQGKVLLDLRSADDCLSDFQHCASTVLFGTIRHDLHWHPFVLIKTQGVVHGFVESGDAAAHFSLLSCIVHVVPCYIRTFCGAAALKLFHILLGRPTSGSLAQFHQKLRLRFVRQQKERPGLIHWGFGPAGVLLKNLSTELLKHGTPAAMVEQRAADAIKAIGSDQIATALAHRQPWKQLKILGNNVKFQFVLPSELAQVVEDNKGRPVTGKGKGKSKSKPTAIQHAALDPSKLQILDNMFCALGHPLAQLHPNQIGPLSSGVVLMTPPDAEPYLRAGKQVSQEPLAIVVLATPSVEIVTSLPHVKVTVPCRCTVDQEPILVDGILVQVGQGLVEKKTNQTLVHIETLDVVTLKVLVYKDEIKGDWNDFASSPIRHLVSLLPKLRRCTEENCSCDAWHNVEQLDVRDPILDVWRRQFLRSGFKPSPLAKADIFSVCLRVPQVLLDDLLAASGCSGAYCEPRSADGTEILSDYTVIWTPRHTLQEMLHLMRTNPAVTGLARLGDRRGLRVKASQAKHIHQLVKPESVYLPGGPKILFTVGPIPYGADRQAVGKILHNKGWECRPLQPTAPCPGRGAMWIVQSTEDPPTSIIHTTQGEIVIVRQKQEVVEPAVSPVTVGSASTVALCGAHAKASEPDPWAKNDPWGAWKPSTSAVAAGPTEGLQQMETRIQDKIQTAVMAKMQAPMEQDDIPDRVFALEGQIQQLLTKQQGFEAQLHDFSGQHTQQIAALQGQVNAQAQQLHGHMENQNQTIQSLFEQQMSQIRGLLAKRPREEGME